MRAGQLDVGLGDCGHAEEVVSPAEEGSECRRERLVAADAHAHGRRHQLLLRDPHLEEAVWMRLRELVGVGRVGHLAVHGHHLGHGGQRQQRVAIRLAGRHLLVLRVGGQNGFLRRRPPSRGRATLRLLRLDLEVLDPTELLDRPLGHVGRQRLAVPTVLVLDLGEPLALDRLGDDDGGLVRVRERFAECPVDSGKIVPVDHDGVAAKRLDPAAIGVQVPAELRLAPLPEAVDVPDRGKVRQLVMACLVDGFPDRAFGEL